MYLDLLKMNIKENYHRGYDSVCNGVEAWLKSRGFKEDDFSNPVFIDKQRLDILLAQGTQYGPGDKITMPAEELNAIREHAFNEGVDHVLSQLRIINPYGDRNGFLDD